MKMKVKSLLTKSSLYIAAFITGGILIGIIAYILIMGIPNLSWSMFSLEYTSENVSLFPALVNTLTVTLLTLAISLPLGIGSAIYLNEYTKQSSSKLVKLVRLTADTLAGIPSIVYGLFGLLFFVTALKWQYSLLAGGCTLAIMVLPLIMSSTEEALRTVPDEYREASYGLGAGKLTTIIKVVLPSAIPGILAGVILAIGRIVGETAALIYTAGTVAQIPDNIMGSGRTLAVHMYALWSEGMNKEESYATAVILLVLVMILNGISDLIASKLLKRKGQNG